ncbi:platelet-activating factor acetylhydrolase-like, partial [Physella acuta]|uniref:platelet-activating factor acetylhydrolase-like n=1 Tax=Physella acuta TaxID=109671 RepID=UPI0027DDBA97
ANYKIWPLWLPRKQYAHGYVYFLKKNKIFGRIANLVGGEVYVPVLWQAPLIKNNEKFPVVIVSHGIGGNRTTLSTYCNELASHGFVVAALEHRDGSASMTLCLTEQLDSSIRDVDEQVHIERHCHSDSDIHSQEDNFDTRVQSAVQFYLDEGTENRESAGGRGSRVRQRRENRRRSVRHNNSCTEEWRRFQHVPVWDDFDLRNGQMYHRADEISDLLNQLISMNEGKHINNILGFGFNTTQFKDRLDISKVAVIGHSFGGASTVATLATDVRFKLGISLDGWFHAVDNWAYKTAKQPCLLLNMEQFQWERNVNQMITFQNANPDADRPMITLKGGCHQSMTDFQFIVPHMLGRLMDVCHTLAPAQAMSTCIEASLAFLHKHLDLPFEQQHQDILDGNHKHLMAGTNVDLSIPDDGPTPP